MNWDWATFVIGAVVGAFLAEAGKELYVWTRRKISPPPPEPKRVSRNFDPEEYVPGSCVWSKQHHVHEKLDAGYTHYLSPEGAPIYRQSSSFDSTQTREFLMVAPDAWKVDSTD